MKLKETAEWLKNLFGIVTNRVSIHLFLFEFSKIAKINIDGNARNSKKGQKFAKKFLRLEGVDLSAYR